MPRGLKVFDVYGELHLDKDELRDAMRGLPGELGPDADRAGNALGKRMSDGLARSVEAGSARLAKARRSEQTATDAVKLAEVRLSEAREKGGQKASTLLALEQRLEQAHRRLADAQSNTVTSTKKLEDAQRRLASSMGDDLDKKLGPRMQKSGDDAGGKLALGMRMSVIRNSPLIVAAIGAGLAAGGPLLLTAATGLFAGIGIVAAAQSDKVQAAWLRTWEHIKRATIADAGVIEPVLTRVAANVGKSFDRMRPLIQGAFSAAAPQIEVFSKGITDLAENALPGMVRAVEAGMPVTQGLASFLAKVGTGLSDFFDRITAHGPAAGQVWSQLGTTMGTLLPTLGELIGQGSELAARVLPLMNSGLGLLLKTVNLLGPALPLVTAGFTAFKVVSSLTGPLNMLSARLQTIAADGGKFGTAMAGNAAAGVSKLSGALPALGVVAAAVGAAFMAASQQTDDWARALLEGGKAAATARAQMADVDSFLTKGATGWFSQIFGIKGYADALGVGSNASDKAKEKAKALFDAMSPLEQAQTRVTQAQNYLNEMTDTYGPTSDRAAGASRALKQAQGELEKQNSDLELAIHGVTQAMIDQANQAMGSIDADFAYQDALDALKDKQKALAVAIRDHGKASEEAKDASRDLAEGIWDTAKKAAAAAPELDGLTQGTAEYDRMVQNLTLRSLIELRKGLGPEMGAVVDQMIGTLKRGGASLDEIGAKKPKPVVDADTGPLDAKVAKSKLTLDVLAGKRPLPIIGLNDAPLKGTTQTDFNLMNVLGGKRPTPVAGLNSAPLRSSYASAMNVLNVLSGRRPMPIATLIANTRSAEAALNYAARSRTATVYMRQVGAALAGGGNVGAAIRGFADGGSPHRRGDGRISGPGGMFDDMVPAMTSSGESIRVANTEWIINGPVSEAQGPTKMAALNAGRADIVVRQPPGGRMAGGSSPQSSTAQTAGRTVMVQRLDVHLQGFDIRDRAEVRRFARELRQALLDLDREQS